MNFKIVDNFAVVLILLVIANGVCSFSVPKEKADESSKRNPEITLDDSNESKYNYNLTDTELFQTDGKVDFYDYEQMERNCCFLARLAAQRGLHCNLKFYSHNLLYRIRNRTHRKHVQIIGNSREQLINQRLMLKFGKCLNGFTAVFELCCWDEVDRELELLQY